MIDLYSRYEEVLLKVREGEKNMQSPNTPQQTEEHLQPELQSRHDEALLETRRRRMVDFCERYEEVMLKKRYMVVKRLQSLQHPPAVSEKSSTQYDDDMLSKLQAHNDEIISKLQLQYEDTLSRLWIAEDRLRDYESENAILKSSKLLTLPSDCIILLKDNYLKLSFFLFFLLILFLIDNSKSVYFT